MALVSMRLLLMRLQFCLGYIRCAVHEMMSRLSDSFAAPRWLAM